MATKAKRVKRAKSPKVLPTERMYRLELAKNPNARAIDLADAKRFAGPGSPIRNTRGTRVVQNWLKRQYGIESKAVPA